MRTRKSFMRKIRWYGAMLVATGKMILQTRKISQQIQDLDLQLTILQGEVHEAISLAMQGTSSYTLLNAEDRCQRILKLLDLKSDRQGQLPPLLEDHLNMLMITKHKDMRYAYTSHEIDSALSNPPSNDDCRRAMKSPFLYLGLANNNRPLHFVGSLSVFNQDMQTIRSDVIRLHWLLQQRKNQCTASSWSPIIENTKSEFLEQIQRSGCYNHMMVINLSGL